MKTLHKLISIITLAVTAVFTASANHFEVNGIYYNKKSDTEVWVGNGATKYTGEVVIPSSVTVNDSTFTVTAIGALAFSGCNNLKAVTIPNTVTEIGNMAFNKCNSLTSIVIPNSVKHIYASAFRDCSSLTSITLGSSIIQIDASAFTGCTGLTKVNITDLAAWCKIIWGDTESNPLNFAHELYLNDTRVSELIIPDTVTEISNMAFMGCTGLTSVTIPNSVTKIGSRAFYKCSELTSVNISDMVAEIGYAAFYGCSSLASVIIPNKVTKIWDSTFYGCSSLASVFIPDSVTSIGNLAFAGCSSLSAVIIPDSLQSCGSEAFPSNTNLIYYDGTQAVVDGLLYSKDRKTILALVDKSLKEVTIPNTVTKIGEQAFYDCTDLTAVHITDLAAWCHIEFYDQSSNPLYYAHSLFLNGTKVTELIIPNSVSSIGQYAFRGCSDITSVTFHGSVSTIDKNAFGGCTGLSKIYCHAAVPPTVANTSVFPSAIYDTATLYVPKGYAETYKAAKIWTKFANIVEGDYEAGVDDVVADEAKAEIVGYYNLQGVMSTHPWDGLNIVVYSDGTCHKIVH